MLEPTDRLKVISRVKAIVVKHHFNIGNVDYADWSRAVDEQSPTLLTADDNTFDEGVRNLLCQLKSSHTNFYHSGTNPTMPRSASAVGRFYRGSRHCRDRQAREQS